MSYGVLDLTSLEGRAISQNGYYAISSVLGFNVTGLVFNYSLKKDQSEGQSKVLINETANITDAPTGTVRVTIPSSMTRTLSGIYYHELRSMDVGKNVVYYWKGKIEFTPAVWLFSEVDLVEEKG